MRPVARAIVARLPGWKVWSVDRRENLLEDHSVLGPVVAGRRPARDAFRYYLESLTSPSITPRFAPVTDAGFARRWGMGVAVRDLRKVIRSARKGGRRVVLAGHSLGAAIAIAYATWDFGGRAGARDLAGLVLIDGGSGGTPIRRARAREQLEQLAAGSPFLDLTGFGVPWALGVLNAVGSTLAVQEPDAPAMLAAWAPLPAALRPPVAATNAAGYGYAVDDDTSPANLTLVHMHIGGLAATGRDLELPIYAFETSLGAGRVLKGARALARRSHLPRRMVTLVDRHSTYDHIDPLSALPAKNAFVKTVVPFLRRAR